MFPVNAWLVKLRMASATPQSGSSSSVELYKSVPARIAQHNTKQLNMKPLDTEPNKFVEGFLSNRVDPSKLRAGLLSQLRMQTMLLDKPYKAPKRVDSLRPPKRLTSREKRELKIYEIPKKNQRYELFLPLHELWLKYMEDLLQLSGSSDGKRRLKEDQMNQKVMKADYHGCVLTVVRSKCPSYVGVGGILLQETQNTLKLIGKDNRIRTIPKANSVFSFCVHDIKFSLYGNHMKFRSSERSARKFKDKPTIDL